MWYELSLSLSLLHKNRKETRFVQRKVSLLFSLLLYLFTENYKVLEVVIVSPTRPRHPTI
jgi:hypothetical protein